MRSCAILGLLSLVWVGCDSSPVVMVDEDGWVVRANAPSIETGTSTAPAFDPRLDGFRSVELSFPTRHAAGAVCAIELSRDGTSLGAIAGVVADGACTADWDGSDSSGALVEPGPVDIQATVTRNGLTAVAVARTEVIRVGIRELRLEGAGREPLLYARMGGSRYGYYEMLVDSVPWRLGADRGALDRTRPELWNNLGSPPDDVDSPDATFSLPTAWVAGATPDVSLTFATGIDPSEVEVRVVAPDGLSLLDEGIVVDGAQATFESTESPVPAVGRYDVVWEWTFEARLPGGEWIPIEGSFATASRFYGLVDTPTFDYSDVPHRAWVDVLDRIALWVDGSSADPVDVAGRIVEGVFFEIGLQYDNVRGASHYTDYPGGWEGASFELSRFADLADGLIINCSDAASIVSTYANMVGIDLRYHIIQHQWMDRFLLNYLHAIGREFGPSPFTSGRNAFRYHAVVGPPDMTVFDSTLALDGDGTPAAPPNELLLVQGLSQMDYLVGLSPEWNDVRVFVDEKVRIR